MKNAGGFRGTPGNSGELRGTPGESGGIDFSPILTWSKWRLGGIFSKNPVRACPKSKSKWGVGGHFFKKPGTRKRSTQVFALVLENLGLQKVGGTSKTVKNCQNIEKSKNT